MEHPEEEALKQIRQPLASKQRKGSTQRLPSRIDEANDDEHDEGGYPSSPQRL
jgi:hypothetical protein